jgi:hypothetical protein
VPAQVRDGLAALITELEAAGPAGLADRRTAFRRQGQIARASGRAKALSPMQRRDLAVHQLLEQRPELLVGVKLVHAGVLTRMGEETPDFECRWRGTEFGVEVTTRARPEAASAMHDLLEQGLWDGPDIGVTLVRTGKLLFSEDPVKTAGIANTVIATIKEHTKTPADQPATGSVPIPELGLTATLHPAGPVSGPGVRVTFQPLLTTEEWDYHWKMAALQIKAPIEKKGAKAYGLPSIIVLDVSRLGAAGQQPLGPWTGEFQEVLDACDLGNLGGALVVRSELTSQELVPLCWRGDSSLSVAVGAVLLGGRMPKAA